MKATTRKDLNLKENETMCEKCVHEDICRREQCGEPYVFIRSCFDFEKKRTRGEWIFKHNSSDIWCSNCDENFEEIPQKFLFCPNCGADMREGEEK